MKAKIGIGPSYQPLLVALRAVDQLWKLELGERYAEVEEAIVAGSQGRDTGNGQEKVRSW